MIKLKNHNKVEKLNSLAYEYVLYPKTARVVPIEMDIMKLVEVDENEVETDTGYASIQVLHDIFGNQYKPVSRIDDRFELVRYCFPNTGKARTDLINFMKSQGLVDMRANNEEIEDMSFDGLNGNEFGIFSAYEVGFVPSVKEDD